MRIYDSNGNLQYSDILGELNFGKYVRNITIDNSSNASSLTSYQVLVIADTSTPISAGRMRADGGDIRFYDGTTSLNYWIEGGINTTSTRIWVKIPFISASSIKVIQMYYGNPNAGSISSGDNTFLFFDDFSGTALDWTNKWKSTNQSLYTVTNGILTLATTSNSSQFLQTKNTFSNFEARFAMQETTKQLYADFVTGSSYQGIDTVLQGGSSNTDIHYFINGTDVGSAPISTATWYYHKVMILGTSVHIITYTNSAWTNVLLDKSGTSSLSGARYPSFFAFYSDTSGCKMDFIYIRNYSNPDPVVSVGSEYIMPLRIK
jgi:hypothetical protein